MTSKYLAATIAVLLTMCLALPVLAADPFNPKPAQGDLTLPMPGGGGMAFRPVYIGEGGGAFAQRKFMAGDPFGGFKEHPTSMTVGGAFLGKRGADQDWLYYMGKYEVTEGQYYAVMGLPQGASQDLLKSTKPITGISWFDASQFVDKYNLWLFENARDKLPQNNGVPGFVRLPGEAEWEFAARGGAAVSADDFDLRQPYKIDLVRCEWFSGPTSSHNKIKEIGLLEPNPLGSSARHAGQCRGNDSFSISRGVLPGPQRRLHGQGRPFLHIPRQTAFVHALGGAFLHWQRQTRPQAQRQIHLGPAFDDQLGGVFQPQGCARDV